MTGPRIEEPDDPLQIQITPTRRATVKTPTKTVQLVLDDENPEDARILALIAQAREVSPRLADWSDSDIVNEALRVYVEQHRRHARSGALRSGPADPDDLDSDEPDPGDPNPDAPSEPEDWAVPGAVHLWLDDVRPAPLGWKHVYTATQAIETLASGGVEQVSLDHDLGEDEGVGTGYDVAVWIENSAADGTLARMRWAIHSANPVGRARMTAALESADQLWDRNEEGG